MKHAQYDQGNPQQESHEIATGLKNNDVSVFNVSADSFVIKDCLMPSESLGLSNEFKPRMTRKS
jgi:hypothetical protein